MANWSAWGYGGVTSQNLKTEKPSHITLVHQNLIKGTLQTLDGSNDALASVP